MDITSIVNTLENEKNAFDEELLYLLAHSEANVPLAAAADRVRKKVYQKDVYIRGLIEFTNFCKNNCYYCGIRRENGAVQRYRLSKQQILECCRIGYDLGFRTFVLQGGEDPYFTDQRICEIVSAVREKYPQCAVTLSVGEKSKQSYRAFYHAGANRYLLRHETANETHYQRLHPDEMSLKNRMRCLFDLKEIGYQVGAGIMVGSPYQKNENLVEDLRFMQKLSPDMIGIGPFLTHKQTPFSQFQNGSLDKTLRFVSVARLMFPHALIPATTALATIDPKGRSLGLVAGANVVMPNLSPMEHRKDYALYENKVSFGEEAAESVFRLSESVEQLGLRIVTDVGNVKR